MICSIETQGYPVAIPWFVTLLSRYVPQHSRAQQCLPAAGVKAVKWELPWKGKVPCDVPGIPPGGTAALLPPSRYPLEERPQNLFLLKRRIPSPCTSTKASPCVLGRGITEELRCRHTWGRIDGNKKQSIFASPFFFFLIQSPSLTSLSNTCTPVA